MCCRYKRHILVARRLDAGSATMSERQTPETGRRNTAAGESESQQDNGGAGSGGGAAQTATESFTRWEHGGEYWTPRGCGLVLSEQCVLMYTGGRSPWIINLSRDVFLVQLTPYYPEWSLAGQFHIIKNPSSNKVYDNNCKNRENKLFISLIHCHIFSVA